MAVVLMVDTKWPLSVQAVLCPPAVYDQVVLCGDRGVGKIDVLYSTVLHPPNGGHGLDGL